MDNSEEKEFTIKLRLGLSLHRAIEKEFAMRWAIAKNPSQYEISRSRIVREALHEYFGKRGKLPESKVEHY